MLFCVCSCHMFCYGQRKVRVIWLVEGLMCSSVIFVSMSRSTAVTFSVSHFCCKLKSVCLESSCTQMHPKFVILHLILGVCVPALHIFILYAMKFRIELWLC